MKRISTRAFWTRYWLRRLPGPASRPADGQRRLRVEELEPRLAPSTNVTTFHNDNFLSGDNLTETQLTPANVNPNQFGKLFSYPVDGYVYAQPLYLARLAIPGKGTHDVVFVATEHNSVYAFDADNPGSGGGLLWQRNLGPSVPQPDVISTDIVPEVGITGTPVIDPATNTLYVVAKTKEVSGGVAHYIQRLHALDVTTGNERANSPVLLGDTTGDNNNTSPISVPGRGWGNYNGILSFNALKENQRTALTLANGVVYIAWASHGDNGPYHGWVVGIRTSDLRIIQVFNTSPNNYASGIWQSGGGLAVDAGGSLYFATGNGLFNANQAGTEYGDSVLRLSTNGALNVADYFTPYEQAILDDNDADLGSGGTMLLPDFVGSAAHRHLLVETGKEGKIYLIDRDNLGGYQRCGTTCDAVVQTLQLGAAGVWGNPAFFQTGPNSGLIYYQGTGDVMKAYTISNGVLSGAPTTRSSTAFGFPGAQPVVSANGTSNGIVWALQVDAAGQHGPAVLYAYNATNLGQQLYSSSQMGTRDRLDGAVKFTAPVIADGKVFVGTQSSVAVFGLFPNSSQPPAAPSNLAAVAVSGTQIQLTWTNNATNATGVKIERSTDGSHFTQVAQVAGSVAAYTDGGLTPSTHYYYRVRATNSAGDSAYSNTASTSTRPAAAVLSVANVGSSQVDLAWSGTAGDHYEVQRSDDGGGTFTTIASVPAFVGAYSDANLAQQTYVYRVRSVSAGDSSYSNTVSVMVGPAVIDHSTGFTNTADLTANGSAQFADTTARLTDAVGQAGSVFTNTRVGIRNFSTSFHIRLHEGTQPNPADGLTFTIQADPRGPAALGANGGGLGYGPDVYGHPPGILNSVAVKIDVYDNEGETNNSTGIFYGGDYPGRAHNPGEVNVSLDPNVVNLRDQHRKRVDLSYDGSVLTVTITDEQHDGGPTSVTQYYTVDIPAKVGSDTAYVGFTGGTGGLFSLQDVLDWRFTSTDPIPAAPTDLTMTYASGAQLDLAWKTHSYNEDGYRIERSADGVNFNTIATVGPNVSSYTDPNRLAGNAYYRIQAFNAAGASAPSNVISPVQDFSVHTDIGSVGRAGSTTYAGGQYTLKGSGADVWAQADAFQFAAQPLSGDGSIIARVASIQNTDYWAKAGLMIREDLGAGSRNVYLYITPDPHNEAVLQWRPTAGGTTQIQQAGVGSGRAPYWLRLVRAGDTFTGYRSADGLSWTLVGSVTVPLASTVEIGLAVTAHNNSSLNTSVFDNVTITRGAQQEGFSVHTDIGSVGVAGSTTYAGGQYTLKGSGTDVWAQADAFQFAAQPLTGDGSIIARVASIQNTDYWAKAGLMIREGLGADARNVYLYLTPDPHNEAVLQWRPTTGGTTQIRQAGVGSGRAPYWLRLVRAGDTFTGYRSADGISWTLVGTATVPMTGTVYIGLAVTAHNNTVLNTSVFDNVQTSQAPPSWSRLAAAAAPSTTAGVPVTLLVTARDAANNRAPGYVGTVQFSSSDWQASLPLSYTFTPADAGYHLFTVYLYSAGPQTITVQDVATGSIMGVAVVQVNPGPATGFWVGLFPDPITAGAPGVVWVAAVDNYYNVVPTYTGTVHLSSSDPLASFDPDYTFTAQDGGWAAFNATLYTVGFQSVVATDVHTGMSGEEDGIEVDPPGGLPEVRSADRLRLLASAGLLGPAPAAAVVSPPVAPLVSAPGLRREAEGAAAPPAPPVISWWWSRRQAHALPPVGLDRTQATDSLFSDDASWLLNPEDLL